MKATMTDRRARLSRRRDRLTTTMVSSEAQEDASLMEAGERLYASLLVILAQSEVPVERIPPFDPAWWRLGGKVATQRHRAITGMVEKLLAAWIEATDPPDHGPEMGLWPEEQEALIEFTLAGLRYIAELQLGRREP